MSSAIIDLSMFYLMLAALLAAGWTIAFLTTRRRLLGEIEQLRSIIYEHVQKHKDVRSQKPELPKAAAAAATDEISSETLAIISAAVAAYLGQAVRIRSARRLPPEELSSWAQQGRVYIQASHNLGMSHHA
jgi:hypothetical protein